MKKTSFDDALILNAATVARVFFRILPLKPSLLVGRSIGRFVYASSPKKRRIARQNLRAAFAAEKTNPELEGIARRSIENLAMSAVEFLRSPELTQAKAAECVKIEGSQAFAERLRNKEGVIFLSGHFGNWELMNVAANRLGYPTVVLAREQKHPRADAFLNALRTSGGGKIVQRGMAIREIIRALKSGRILGIVSDQDGGREGTFVRFFGRSASTPPGVVSFALKTGASIFPLFMFRKGLGKHVLRVHEALALPPSSSPEDVEKEALQKFSDLLENAIREAPDQWLWAHKRWKSTPDRSVLVLSDGKAGHLNQSLALLAAMREQRRSLGAEDAAFRSKIVEVRFRTAGREKVFRRVSALFGGKAPFAPFFLKWVLTAPCYHEIMNFYADAVISCGSSLADVNWALSRENGSKCVAVMTPPSPRRFDAVIAPRHDGPRARGNVFVTEGPVAPAGNDVLQKRGASLVSSLGLPAHVRRIGLFVGGDAGRVHFSPEVLEKILAGLLKVSGSRASILATTSRRTPAWAEDRIRATFANNPVCPYLVIANESNPEGAAANILGASDVLVVSGESMSMVSEAVSTGKAVVVFMPSDTTPLKKKHRAFLTELANREWIRIAGADTFADDLARTLEMPVGSTAYAEANRQALAKAAEKVIA